MTADEQAQRELAEALKRLLGMLVESRLTEGDHSEALRELAAARPELERLKAQLGPEETRAVFREYWRLERRTYIPFFEQGMDADVLREVLWQWLDVGEPAAADAGPATPVRTGQPVRPVAFPDLAGSAYVYVETVRAVVADESDFAYAQHLAEQLIAERGYGFGGVVLDDRGNAVTPSWICADSVAVSPGRHRLAVGATLAHAALGLPAALDLGVRDGRAASWEGRAPEGLSLLPDRCLFLADTRERWLEMTELAGSVCSVDASPDGATLGLLELWAGVAAVSVADATTGERRLLTTVHGLDGSEQIRFSADGAWLLVPRFSEPVLVHVESARLLRLPTAGPIAWWPARSPSSMMLLAEPLIGPGGVPQPQLIAYDLADGTAESLGLVELPVQPDLDALRGFPMHLEVSADGSQALCMTSFGPPAAFQEQHGSRPRVSLLDVEQRRVEVVGAPFAGTIELEREHRSARWLERPPESSFTLADSLVERLGDPWNELGAEQAAGVAGDITNIAVLGIRALVDAGPEGSPHRLRPEVLRSLEALHRLLPGATAELDGWVDSVCEHFAGAVELEGCPPEIRDGWRKIVRGWERIKDPSRGAVPWEQDRWFEAP